MTKKTKCYKVIIQHHVACMMTRLIEWLECQNRDQVECEKISKRKIGHVSRSMKNAHFTHVIVHPTEFLIFDTNIEKTNLLLTSKLPIDVSINLHIRMYIGEGGKGLNQTKWPSPTNNFRANVKKCFYKFWLSMTRKISFTFDQLKLVISRHRRWLVVRFSRFAFTFRSRIAAQYSIERWLLNVIRVGNYLFQN